MKWTSKPIDASLYGNLTYPEVMAFVTGPIFLLKNIINVVQLWKASKILVGVDLAERAAARASKQVEVEEKQKS
jgi:CDP-diacylglycerol--inositol 3-phosphatidyltransferase